MRGEASCGGKKCMSVLTALLLAVYVLNAFKLCTIGHRLYEICISWTIAEIHPHLTKLDDCNAALLG